ncbi:putative nucleic acid-binding Zn ribbon protein [Nocardioides albertanoniae]|uniref:Putative nucleic acid-binding Zn ribbon protein n=2 Tax=Nocardioides albertanoniae TaxID=1175486 RepID=A0A543A154_9ACTN|nr:putative nucleic acid-binding Zn ribbon protein [Nocardioides albertanoniae]
MEPNAETDGAEADETTEEIAEKPADGLDLARSLTRATARMPAPKAGTQRKRRTPPDGGPRRGRVSGARPDDRDPQLIDAVVSRMVDDHGWDTSLRVHGVMARWPDIVGEEIADHTTPESYADGKLSVRTDSTAWATQLKLLAPNLVKRLNQELGHGTVVMIEVLGPHLPSWKKGPRGLRDGRGPRDTYG